MYRIIVQVAAPSGSEQAVKETLAAYLERFGDARVISIEEENPPQQMRFDNQTPQIGSNHRR